MGSGSSSRVVRLGRADRFVEAASLICEESRLIGVDATAIMLHRTSGPVALAVDTVPEISVEQRLLGMTREHWETSPVFARLREKLGPIGSAADPEVFHATGGQPGYMGAASHLLVMPLVGPQGWFGTIVAGNREPLSSAIEREVAMLATHLSVWCTDRGVGLLPEVAGRELGPRQYKIARLAAAGRTNIEIAEELGITINTVKARLKQVFDRLGVTNRIELAHQLRRFAPLDEVARGVTQHESVTVTRALDT